MATPTYPVFDGDGTHAPKRPVASTDLGGLYKANAIGFEPDPETQVTAEDCKQWMMCIEALGRMTPILQFSIGVATGMGASVPSYLSSVNSTLLTSAVTVVETATGRYTATWASGIIPPVGCIPTISTYRSGGNVLVPSIYTRSNTSVVFETRDFAGALSGVSTGVVIQIF